MYPINSPNDSNTCLFRISLWDWNGRDDDQRALRATAIESAKWPLIHRMKIFCSRANVKREPSCFKLADVINHGASWWLSPGNFATVFCYVSNRPYATFSLSLFCNNGDFSRALFLCHSSRRVFNAGLPFETATNFTLGSFQSLSVIQRALSSRGVNKKRVPFQLHISQPLNVRKDGRDVYSAYE